MQQAELLDKVNAWIANRTRLRDEAFIRQVFEEHKDSSEGLIRIDKLGLVLQKLRLDEGEPRTDFRTARFNLHYGLNFEEFKEYLKCRPSILEEFAETIPLSRLIADSLSFTLDSEKSKECEMEAIKAIASLSSAEIDIAADAMLASLKELLKRHCETLKNALFEKTQHRASSANLKFVLPLCMEKVVQEDIADENGYKRGCVDLLTCEFVLTVLGPTELLNQHNNSTVQTFPLQNNRGKPLYQHPTRETKSSILSPPHDG